MTKCLCDDRPNLKHMCILIHGYKHFFIILAILLIMKKDTLKNIGLLIYFKDII